MSWWHITIAPYKKSGLQKYKYTTGIPDFGFVDELLRRQMSLFLKDKIKVILFSYYHIHLNI